MCTRRQMSSGRRVGLPHGAGEFHGEAMGLGLGLDVGQKLKVVENV